MRTLRHALAPLLLVISLGAQALQGYLAEYDLTVRGVGAGRVRHEAIFTERGYRFETIGSPSLAAKMLGFGEIREKAEGKIAGDKVVPTYYRRDMQGNDNQHLSYDYANAVNGEIQAIVGAQNKTLRANRRSISWLWSYKACLTSNAVTSANTTTPSSTKTACAATRSAACRTKPGRTSKAAKPSRSKSSCKPAATAKPKYTSPKTRSVW